MAEIAQIFLDLRPLEYMEMRLQFFLLLALALLSCHGEQKAQVEQNGAVEKPRSFDGADLFCRDSAFSFVKSQCDFGPRVPNTPAHEACAAYLVSQLKRLGAEVVEQKAVLTAYDGTQLKSNNIIGSFFPEKGNRVIFFSHWDSRPFCDQDEDKSNHRKPVMGANDGASGVGVLLEMARVIQQREPLCGVDVVFFDSEDYGAPYFFEGKADNDWCLGSQYWSRNPHYKEKPRYGVLLDMVGGAQPTFFIDKVTERYALSVAERLWSRAAEMGYGASFAFREGGMIMDDHYYVNIWAGVPTVDVIDFNADRGFPRTWHTVDDTPANIDPASLEMVGRVITSLLY